LITNIQFFIDSEIETENLKVILGEMCDVITKYGHASDPDIDLSDSPVNTIVAVNLLDENNPDTKDLVSGIILGSFMVVIPTTSKESNESSSNY